MLCKGYIYAKAYICKEGDNFLTAAFHLTHCLVEEFNCTVRLLLYTVSIVQLVKYTQHSTLNSRESVCTFVRRRQLSSYLTSKNDFSFTNKCQYWSPSNIFLYLAFIFILRKGTTPNAENLNIYFFLNLSLLGKILMRKFQFCQFSKLLYCTQATQNTCLQSCCYSCTVLYCIGNTYAPRVSLEKCERVFAGFVKQI